MHKGGITDANVDLVELIEQPTWKSILLDLVRKEKMDVWAIDLIELSQKYLQKIQELKENNLRIPANAMLACAILLKLKSRAIKLPYEEPEQEEKLPEIGELPELKPIARIKERTVTLDELLREIEAVIEKTRSRTAITRETEKIMIEFPSFSKQDLNEKMQAVYAKILKNVDEQGLVLFSSIVDKNNILEIVTTFLCLLFLAAKGSVCLWQESFFGEIFIALPDKGKNG